MSEILAKLILNLIINKIEEYSGMNIEKLFKPKIQENIPIMNELKYFQLFITDEILELLTEESNNYMKKILLINMEMIINPLF